ncbi:MAG TPA: O-antigen ligase family protein [Mobilitalea sp.]|nr:O-antigen ligase family protein [Mobilitalea sp.]
MGQSQQKKDQKNKVRNVQRTSSKTNITKYDESSKNYFLIPMLFIIVMIPLITRLLIYDPKMSQYPWFPNTTEQFDLFLYYKHWFIIITAVIMIVIITIKAICNHKSLKMIPIFIPLIVYAVLTIGSTIFSKYANYSITGSFEQFESVFVLIGYCIITFYSYQFVKTEKDMKNIIYFIIVAVLIMSFIGLTQLVGHDIITSKFGTQLIVPSNYRISGWNMNFEKGRVYLSLYNPNYVGVYAALMVPILIVVALFIKEIKIIILSLVGIIGLVVAMIGSKSLTGFICIIVSLLFMILFIWRYLIKRLYITLPIFILIIISIFVLNNVTDNYMWNKIKYAVFNNKNTYNVTSMETNDNNVSLTYKGNKLYVEYILNNNQTANIIPYDANEQQLECSYDEGSNELIVTDTRFSGITIGTGTTAGVFYINVNGKKYNFTNTLGDGTYYYLNENTGKYDKMINAPSALFTGYETFASGRGYIWSRTIPLIKDYIFLGSGPDTYTLVFPQNDYLNLQNNGYGGSIMTKPHSLYLQIAVQTGVLSLIAFLVFYGMYFISSICLYIKGRFDTLHSKLGVAIFVGTISYMIAGITNDSCVATAPVFWCLIGIGIAVNQKVKSMILQEKVNYVNKNK